CGFNALRHYVSGQSRHYAPFQRHQQGQETMASNENLTADIVVVGGGPTGLCAALVAERRGFSVILLAPSGSHIETDARTTALMVPAIAMLEELDVWTEVAPNSAPLRTLRIVDDTNRLLRAPLVDFHADEIGEGAFGYNIPNQKLNAALETAVKDSSINRLDASASAIAFEKDRARVILSDGAVVDADLVVGADGSHSIVRQAAGIDVRKWSYEQTACVLAFDHARNHENVSTEFHTPHGPFTQVPLPGNRSSLVWVMKPEDAVTFVDQDEDALCEQIEQQMQSILGKISNVTRPQAWPLSSAVAHKFSGNRVALIGQAAHVFPPIGAQGLNLGFRDILDLGKALDCSKDNAGSDAVTSTYNLKRLADVYLRTGAVDALNRSLLSGFLPLQAGRVLGMGVLKNVAPLRELLMREGIKPGGFLRRSAS
ncbi:MAG: UbiH/UbiF family hydroxylase, partial [Pseudomonadota bacterium]